MKRIFNKTALKFILGFIGLVTVGLIGIFLASYLAVEESENIDTSNENIL